MPLATPTPDSAADLNFSFGRLLLFAAQELGFEDRDDDGLPILPEDVRKMWAAEQAVKDGLRMLVGEYEWPWLVREVEIGLTPTHDPAVHVGDNVARYRLPWWFGSAIGISYGPDSIRQRIELRPYLEIRRFEADLSAGADPICAAVYDLDPESSDGDLPGKALAVWPAPSSDQTIIVLARAFPVCPTSDDDRFIAGPEYGEVVKSAVLLAAAKERTDDNRIARRKAEYDDALRKAKDKAARSKPQVTGRLEPTIGPSINPQEYRNPRTLQYNGVTMTA